MKKVFFLGAGASCDAGYPLTCKVIEEIDKYIKGLRCQVQKDQWEKFKKIREHNSFLDTIFSSNNPELILTSLNLFELADSELLINTFQKYMTQERRGKEKTCWDKISKPKESKFYQEMKSAAYGFQYVLNEYFLEKHCNDFDNRKNPNYLYLTKAFNKLKADDTIISTNWDTLAERALMDMQEWYPWDGYGFSIDMEFHDQIIIRRSGTKPNLDNIFKKQSEIKVLKLHGSIGWHYDARDKNIDPIKKKIHLRYPSFLQFLIPPECNNQKIRDKNSMDKGSYSPNNEPIFILPSYIKNLNNIHLQSIWHQAGEALKNAKEIIFLGYSLPKADVAVRVLINPIKYRLENNDVKVIAIVGKDNNEGEKTWKEFFGDNIIVEKENAITYF